MISVAIVEDIYEHQQFFKSIINNSPDLKCVGVFSTGQYAIEEIVKLKPDVVITDMVLPDISGVECIKHLKPLCQDTKFMICTVFDYDEGIFEALKAGASSYILKKSKAYQVRDAIYDVHNGNMPVSNSIATKILNYFTLKVEKERKKDIYEPLNEREIDILKQLGYGKSYQQIMDSLDITLGTLKWNLHNIYRKLHAKNRVEAVNKFFSD